MQEDLKLRFGIRSCLVNEVTLPTPADATSVRIGPCSSHS
jgi:hypothetical protein